MKKFRLYLLLCMCYSIMFSACSKDDNPIEGVLFAKEKVQSFANDSLFNLAFSEVIALTKEERELKETKQGFKSFGTICQEFYETINPDQFKNIEELKMFVAENSEYLQLIPEQNGEYTLEVIAYDNPYRYLVNENREVKIGEKKYKLMETSLVDITGEVLPQINKIQKASIQEGCKLIDYFYQTKDNSGDRTVFKITNEFVRHQEGSVLRTKYRVQPYKRTMGVWYQCNRSISLNISYKGILYPGNRTFPFNCYKEFRTSGRILEGEYDFFIGDVWDVNYRIFVNNFSFSGWTPSVPAITWSCSGF